VVAYVTCSPHPAETSAVVDDVLRTRADVTRLNTSALVAELLAATHPELELGGSSDLQLWTHRHGTDSMYLALLRRD
jgi:16S rRNA (cytosine967-C5)-methyltransferase